MVNLLDLSGVSKSFEGVTALDEVSFDLRPGEVHALVGENGAGKSTLVKIVTGAHRADSGTLAVDGRTIRENDPRRSRRLGIAAIYQQPALFPDLTVAENISLGIEQGTTVDWRKRRDRARALLERVRAQINPDEFIRNLSMPEQQLVEIAKALGGEARVLVMDEPTASLTHREVDNLFRLIRELRTQGVGIIYVSHRLEELFQVADRVTVLRDGRVVATRSIAEVDREELIRLMVGRELSAVFPKREVPIGAPILETRKLGCRAAGVRDVSLSVHTGEILGLAGLVGAGRTEFARILFGITPADSGQVLFRGKAVRIDSPDEAVACGIAYVPEDRRRHGVILDLPVRVNTSLAVLREISDYGFLDTERELELAAEYSSRLDIRASSIHAPAGQLSGGNQQKVALARWLAVKPTVLILDEPTQGIDVGAKSEIHKLMVDLAAQGLAIIMISSELPEILGMSDRIAVMRDGTVTGILDRSEATQEKLLSLALV